MAQKKNRSLVFAVTFASAAIAGSLVYLGTQVGGSNISQAKLQTQMFAAIDDYFEQKEEEAQKAEAAKYQPEVLIDDDAFLGSDGAEIAIVEFSDYQCPYCRMFFNETYPQLKKEYVETGKVKFVYRDLPIPSHEDAEFAAVAASCAGDQDESTKRGVIMSNRTANKSYYEMHDKIFAGQNALGQGTVEIPEENVMGYAKEMELDMTEFKKCLKDDKKVAEVQADRSYASSVGINATPNFVIINLRKPDERPIIVPGAQPFSEFKAILDEELAK